MDLIATRAQRKAKRPPFQGPLHLTYATSMDPHDVRAWSGTVHFIAKSLEDQGVDMDYLGELQKGRVLLNKAINRMWNWWSPGSIYPVERTIQLGQRFAEQIGEHLANAGGHGDGCVLGAAARGEGIGLHRVHRVHARHRHAGALRDVLHHCEELRVLVARDLVRVRGLQHDVRGEPVRTEVHRQGDHEEDERPTHAADGTAHGDEQAAQRSQEDSGLQVVHSFIHSVVGFWREVYARRGSRL